MHSYLVKVSKARKVDQCVLGALYFGEAGQCAQKVCLKSVSGGNRK